MRLAVDLVPVSLWVSSSPSFSSLCRRGSGVEDEVDKERDKK